MQANVKQLVRIPPKIASLYQVCSTQPQRNRAPVPLSTPHRTALIQILCISLASSPVITHDSFSQTRAGLDCEDVCRQPTSPATNAKGSGWRLWRQPAATRPCLASCYHFHVRLFHDTGIWHFFFHDWRRCASILKLLKGLKGTLLKELYLHLCIVQ